MKKVLLVFLCLVIVTSAHAATWQEQQRQNNINRAEYWKAKGYNFDPEWMTAYAMDRAVETQMSVKTKDHAPSPHPSPYQDQFVNPDPQNLEQKSQCTITEILADNDEDANFKLTEESDSLYIPNHPLRFMLPTIPEEENNDDALAGTEFYYPKHIIESELSGSSILISPFTFYNITDLSGESIHGSSTRIGSFTFHDFSSSEGESITGSTLRIGDFDFHDFRSSNGGSLSGSSTTIGSFQFHDLNGPYGTSVSGTSTRIGDFVFHDFTDSEGNHTSGTTMEIGSSSFTDFSDSEGNYMNGSTIEIGSSTFTDNDW